MTYLPPDARYSRDNSWIVPTTGGRARIGLTEFGLEEVSEVLLVDTMASAGEVVSDGDLVATLEGVRRIVNVFAPTKGTVTAVNQRLGDNPDLVNDDTYGDGWIIEIALADPGSLKSLLTADQYRAYISAPG